MFNPDKPICHMNDDKLDRSEFAKRIAKAILNYQTKDNYSIALQGKWGCGKTSVLNMVIEEINHTPRTEENNGIIVIQFNPWNFTNANELINQFFMTLTNSLKIESKDEKVRNVGAAIERYANALQYSEYVPLVGKPLKIVLKLLASYGETIKEGAADNLNDVSNRKREVEDALSKLNSRILVVIDDIDRLPNDQIRLIFQLVNAVAGFKNITYLLSYDKEIVSRALGEVQKCNGEEYLEKIIQVPFDIPPINVVILHQILLDKLDQIKGSSSEIDYDKNHWTTVFHSCISPFIKTLRDVNRYYNVLTFSYSSVKGEVNFTDMAGLCALQIFATPIYEWIKNNKGSIVGGGSKQDLASYESDEKDEYKHIFAEVYPESPDVMYKAIVSLFPRVPSPDLVFSDGITESALHRGLRIASAGKFDLYFSLSLDTVKLKREDVYGSLYFMEEAELRLFLKDLDMQGLFNEYLAEVRHNLPELTGNRTDVIISALVFQSGRIGEEKKNEFTLGTFNISVDLLHGLLEAIQSEEKRYDILSVMLSSSDFEAFQYFIRLLFIMEQAHGKVGEQPSFIDVKLINLEQLAKLESVFIERVTGFAKEKEVLDWKEARRTCLLWQAIEYESYNDHMRVQLTNPISMLKYISVFAESWTGTEGANSYSFRKYSYLDFLNEEMIANTINQERMKGLFWSLDRRVIEVSAAFIISLEKEVYNGVDAVDINEIIQKWERSI